LRLDFDQLPAALARGLAPIYLISGDEPLMAGESADAVRAAARKAGYMERIVFSIDRSFVWDELRQASQEMSLFAERRLFELRMPSGKPDKGAALLAAIADAPPPDILFLVLTGRLDAKTSDSAWVRAIERSGVWVRVWPVGRAALPGWLESRARSLDLKLEAGVAQSIADRVEGNLLAAKQELDMLALLANGAVIDLSSALSAIGDSARYDVLQLGEAAAGGDAPRALRILTGLRNEGVDPVLILWALLRELRGMYQAREAQRLGSRPAPSAWNQAARPSQRALDRLRKVPLERLLAQAARTDRIIKGLASGDAWSAITALAAELAGALQGTPDSGRVSA
jgi:DNA polymerase III subunit delta